MVYSGRVKNNLRKIEPTSINDRVPQEWHNQAETHEIGGKPQAVLHLKCHANKYTFSTSTEWPEANLVVRGIAVSSQDFQPLVYLRF